MKDILDVHTHSLASGHAYNTIEEMVHTAQEKGLEILGITEHAPRMPGSCQDFYFDNLKVVPRLHGSLELLLGVELNILDEYGTVDLKELAVRQMDVVIASLHAPCIHPGSQDRNTQCLIEAMKNPYINIIGHPDDGRFPVDMEAVVQAAKEFHTLLEVNNNSLNPKGYRKDARKNDIEMLRLCSQYGVPVILSSDAHYHKDILDHSRAVQLLEEIGFPEDLVVNTEKEKLYPYINKYL